MSVPHLLRTTDLTVDEIYSIINSAQTFLAAHLRGSSAISALHNKRIVLAFFEASTRTRLSFETAAHRLGATTCIFQATGSSVEKGESFEETIETLNAMGFDAIVLRHSMNGAHNIATQHCDMSVINAGEGSVAHPTQALLDACALLEHVPSLHNLKVCIVGDLKHSRVAHSNMELFLRLGANVGLCSPEELQSSSPLTQQCTLFNSITEAAEWASVLCMLRIQHERFSQTSATNAVQSIEKYRERFAWTYQRSQAQPEMIIMHPGPVNLGVELDAQVLQSEHSLVHRQVSHGVAIRMAVLQHILCFTIGSYFLPHFFNVITQHAKTYRSQNNSCNRLRSNNYWTSM